MKKESYWTRFACMALIACWALLASSQATMAQWQPRTSIAVGRGNPENFWPNATWFLDTVKHHLYEFRRGLHNDSAWLRLEPLQVDQLFECHGWAIYHNQDGYAILGVDRDWKSRGCMCGDSLLWLWDDLDAMASKPQKEENQFRLNHPDHCWDYAGTPDTLGGLLAFNITMPFLNSKWISCDENHTWGMIDPRTNLWLIEPKYDAPFHFTAGIAEVIYYGEKHKINEQGEFVE